MDKNQALNLLVQVVEHYKGTAEEHRVLAKALSLIMQLVQNAEEAGELRKEVKTDK